MTTPEFPALHLKKNEERRLRQGHLWVFSNEVDTTKSPLKGFQPGEVIRLLDYRGKSLGTGYVNPNSLIAARLVSRDDQYPFQPSLIVHRLKIALSLREKLYPLPFYRLVYGESDGLPGLVVDRYDDILVVQISTAGMETQREAIIDALNKVIKPKAILFRNDVPIRELEGLPRYVELVQGEIPEFVPVKEHGADFEVALHEGQKTGWFFDQHDNRAGLARYVKDARVLDLFSYVGGWGIQAVRAGAASSICVDESGTATDLVAHNAELNQLADKVTPIQGEAFSVLKLMLEQKQQFDVVVVDPPAFVKRKKDLKKGAEAYRRINELAMRLLSRDGFLVSCSCSQHMSRDALLTHIAGAARHLGRSAQLVAEGRQSADHPVHPSIPETAYLHALFMRVSH